MNGRTRNVSLLIAFAALALAHPPQEADMTRAPRSLHIPATLRWGVILAFVTATISGVSIFVNGLAVKQLPDPALYTTLKNGVAAAPQFEGGSTVVGLVALACLAHLPSAQQALYHRVLCNQAARRGEYTAAMESSRT